MLIGQFYDYRNWKCMLHRRDNITNKKYYQNENVDEFLKSLLCLLLLIE